MRAKRFFKVNVEISNICNLQCSFCPEVVRQKHLMEPELFRKIALEIAPLTELVCLHLMGDPLIHPRLSEFVEICEEHGLKIFLVTNGILLKDKVVDLLLRKSFHQVNFSLHSFSDNYKNRDPSKYLENIFTFTERAFEENPDLYINYRLWNLKEASVVGELNLDMLRRIEERFGHIPLDHIDVRNNRSARVRNRLYLHFDSQFVWPALDLPILSQKGTCYGLTNHFGILADGTVVPCCLDKEGNIPLGHLREHSIEEILASPRAQQMLKGFRENHLNEHLCQRCQYAERFR